MRCQPINLLNSISFKINKKLKDKVEENTELTKENKDEFVKMNKLPVEDGILVK